MKRKKKSLIKTTKREPKWKRDLRTAGKELKRETWNLLGGIGVATVILVLIRVLANW